MFINPLKLTANNLFAKKMMPLINPPNQIFISLLYLLLISTIHPAYAKAKLNINIAYLSQEQKKSATTIQLRSIC